MNANAIPFTAEQKAEIIRRYRADEKKQSISPRFFWEISIRR